MTNIPKINNGNAVLDSLSISNYDGTVRTVQTAKGPTPIETITPEILEESFDEIQDSIATNANSAADGNFIKISDEYEKYWTDGKLKFVEHEETGTYQIQQLDENGNWVVMGYTTKEAYDKYVKVIDENLLKTENNAQETEPGGTGGTFEKSSSEIIDDIKQESLENFNLEEPLTDRGKDMFEEIPKIN